LIATPDDFITLCKETPVDGFPDEILDGYAAMNGVYAAYFPPGRLPARTCVGVTGLARDALVEIDFVARRPRPA